LAGETGILVVYPPHCHVVLHKSHDMTWDGTRAADVGSESMTSGSSLSRHYKVTRFYFKRKMGTRTAILEISLGTQGLFFRKVAYPRYDVTTGMI
jgi:hypothetical protein